MKPSSHQNSAAANPAHSATNPQAGNNAASGSKARRPHNGTQEKQPLNYRVLFGSLSGSVIEWFDFLIYGTVAALVFNKIYFPSDNPFMATFLAYVSFSLTFFFRPLGGVIFSHIGDRIGRKKTLFITCLLYTSPSPRDS